MDDLAKGLDHTGLGQRKKDRLQSRAVATAYGEVMSGTRESAHTLALARERERERKDTPLDPFERGEIMAVLADHTREFDRIDKRLDSLTSNQADTALLIAKSASAAQWGGASAGLIAMLEAGRLIGHSLGLW